MRRPTTRAIRDELDRRYEAFRESPAAVDGFVALDPVRFPRLLAAGGGDRAAVEITAFLSATIAWGRRDMILRSAERLFDPSGDFDPLGRCSAKGAGKRVVGRGRNIHRTFFESDLAYFVNGFRRYYERHESLEELFLGSPAESVGESKCPIWLGIERFRAEMAAGNGGAPSRHVANAAAGSACKRMHLALRWLVRRGPVDLGLWTRVDPSALYVPLDVHVARSARSLGLLERKSNDRKAVVELTERLREFCPEDPVKYDFVLFDSASFVGAGTGADQKEFS